MQIHKYAKLFPPLEGEEYKQLVEDIRDNGLQQPIVRINGAIIDGANRYRACRDANVEPLYIEYGGRDPMGYVISANVRRRHLNSSQRGLIASNVERLKHGDVASQQSDEAAAPSLPTAEQVAGRFGIHKGTLQMADRVKREAPEYVPDVAAGRIGLREALHQKRVANAKAAAKKKSAKKKTKARQSNPREVKEYLSAIKHYAKAVRLATDIAEAGKFSPEAARYTRERHRRLKDEMAKLDDMLKEIGNG